MGFLERMWRRLRKGRIWIAGVAGLLLLSFWTVSSSESFQSCRAGEKSDFQDAVFHRAAAPAPPEQGDSVQDCVEYFLEENEPGIAALSVLLTTLFTGVLAISTIGLWNSTKSLHEETKRLAALAESQSQDMKACVAAAQKPADIADPSLADLQDASTHSRTPPNI
jgi:hypothetical protein